MDRRDDVGTGNDLAFSNRTIVISGFSVKMAWGYKSAPPLSPFPDVSAWSGRKGFW